MTPKEMKEFIERSIAETMDQHGIRFPPVIGLGPLTLHKPSQIRRVHKELIMRTKGSWGFRHDLELRLGVVCKEVAHGSSTEKLVRWRDSLWRKMGIEVVNELVKIKVCRRRPFRVDASNADAWMVGALLRLEST